MIKMNDGSYLLFFPQVRIFPYLIGRESAFAENLKWMACANKGGLFKDGTFSLPMICFGGVKVQRVTVSWRKSITLCSSGFVWSFWPSVCVHTYTSTDEFVGARQHKQVYATGGNGFQLHRPDVSYYFFFELKVQMNHSDAPLSSSFLCGHGCLNA